MITIFRLVLQTVLNAQAFVWGDKN